MTIEDNVRKNVAIPIIPLRVAIVLTVRELVPCSRVAMAHVLGIDRDDQRIEGLLRASVSLWDSRANKAHNFAAVPVVKSHILSVNDARSGVSHNGWDFVIYFLSLSSCSSRVSEEVW